VSERHIIVMEVVVPDLDLGEAPWDRLRTEGVEIGMCQSWRIDATPVPYEPAASAAPARECNRHPEYCGCVAPPPTTVEPTAHASEDGKGCERCGGAGRIAATWPGEGTHTIPCPSCAGTGRAR
jgi:hypothetical protein